MVARTWNGSADNWNTPADWTGGAVPDTTDDVTIDSGSPQVTAPIDAKSIDNAGALQFHDAGPGSSVVGNLVNSGELSLDADDGDTGGSTLTIGGALSNSGTITVGNGSTFVTTTTLEAGSFDVNDGSLLIVGRTTHQAQVIIGSDAGIGTSGHLSGRIELEGNALLQFAGGQIGTIDGDSALTLNGIGAHVDIAGSGYNSALMGLADNEGTFGLANGASVTIGGDLVNAGDLNVDAFDGEGGSTLAIGGAVTNYGTIAVGNDTPSGPTTVSAASIDNDGGLLSIIGSDTNQATVSLASAAGLCATDGLLDGDVELIGNALLVFGGGGTIHTIELNASLTLVGAQADIAIAGSLGSNSALAGLSYVDGALVLADGATVATDSGIDLLNTGVIAIDLLPGEGGSTLSIGGTILNDYTIGVGNASLSADTTLSAAAMDNSLGLLSIQGGTTYQATVSLASTAGLCSADGLLDGAVELHGNALLEFATGTIDTIEAHGSLWLDGALARVNAADADPPVDNSALVGLADNEGGFRLSNGASVAIGGDLVNDGGILVDAAYGEGGSTLTIDGMLTNTDTVLVGNFAPSGSTTLTVGAIDNDGGYLSIVGTDTGQATVSVASAAGLCTVEGELDGDVELIGNALLMFASGTIDTIDLFGSLVLDGAQALVAVAAAADPSSNSALVGLANIDGALDLSNGASVSITDGLANTGYLQVDGSPGQGGGSALTIGGTLLNTGRVALGNTDMSSMSTISADALDNQGFGWIDVYGSATSEARLEVGSLTNSALITVHAGGVLDIADDLDLESDSTLTVEDGGTLTTGAMTTVLKTGDGTISIIDMQGQSFESRYRIVVESGTLRFTGLAGTTDPELTGAGIIQGEVSLDGNNVLTITPTGYAVGASVLYHFWHTDLALAYTELVAPDGSMKITGSNLGEVLTGDDFDDTILAGSGADTLNGEAGNDDLRGRDGIDALNGGLGNDRLDGGAGADVMTGGEGDDRYVVDDPGDEVVELPGEGVDTIYAKVDYILGVDAEIEFLRANAGDTGLMLGGNRFDNQLTGLAGDDVLDGGGGSDKLYGKEGSDTLYGGEGDDRLYGNEGTDTLYGGEGDDRLDGGASADSMTGGAGNDVFYVDNPGDEVHELTGDGTDTIYAATSFTLATGEEIEILRAQAGATGLALGGNEIDNALYGGTGDDALSGGDGKDRLYGNDGADTLDGGAGNDRLKGGAGADIFLFDSEFIAVTNVDTVVDFELGIDKIHLDRTYFTGLAFGQLTAFSIDAPAGTDPQIVYSSANGSLSYDSNGTAAGGSHVFAKIAGIPALTADSFVVV